MINLLQAAALSCLASQTRVSAQKEGTKITENAASAATSTYVMIWIISVGFLDVLLRQG